MKTKVEYASFQISDIGSNYYIANKLFELQKEHPEYFIDGVKLETVLGSWPSAIWQGDRPYFGFTPFKTIKKKIKSLKKNDAGIYYTFNNRSLKSTDIYDNYCNLIMKESNDEKNIVEIYDDNLEKYIREKYNKVKISKRITNDNFDEINEDKYDYYLLDTTFNDDYEKLSTIKHPEKIIIILNDYFMKGDPKVEEFYNKVSKSIKNLDGEFKFDIDRYTNFNDLMESDNLVKYYQVGKLLQLGISHFRIEGRNTAIQYYYIPSLFYYLIQEEYKNDVFNYLKEAFFSPLNEVQKNIL